MANSLMRIDPFRDLTRFDPLRDIDDLFRDLTVPVWRGEQTPRMRMDVSETEQQYLVQAELPGVQKEDIKVSVHGNQVSLSAEVKNEKSADAAGSGRSTGIGIGSSGGTLRNERYYGLVQRNFTLPQEVDDDQAEARYENGVLSLTLPKKIGTGGKQLAIQ